MVAIADPDTGSHCLELTDRRGVLVVRTPVPRELAGEIELGRVDQIVDITDEAV